MQQMKQEESSRQNINNFNNNFKTISEKDMVFFCRKKYIAKK